MECNRPGVVTEEDLVAYADGEASPAVEAHVRECARCAALVRDYAQTQADLRRVLGAVACPTPQMLSDYECGLLATAERTALARHIRACPRCTEELSTLRTFLSAPVPAPVPKATPMSALRRVVAVLSERTAEAAPASLRGTTESNVLSYRAHDVSLTVDVRPGERQGIFTVAGLVVREDAARAWAGGGAVSLVEAKGPVRLAQLDELGNFEFTVVLPGAYRLEVVLGDEVVVVEDLRVGD